MSHIVVAEVVAGVQEVDRPAAGGCRPVERALGPAVVEYRPGAEVQGVLAPPQEGQALAQVLVCQGG